MADKITTPCNVPPTWDFRIIRRANYRELPQDIQLRLNSIPPPRGSSSVRLCHSTAPTAPELVLQQLSNARRLVNDSLDIVDVTTFTGDPMNANFISGQMKLLADNLMEARQTIKGGCEEAKKPWYEDSADENVCVYPIRFYQLYMSCQ